MSWPHKAAVPKRGRSQGWVMARAKAKFLTDDFFLNYWYFPLGKNKTTKPNRIKTCISDLATTVIEGWTEAGLQSTKIISLYKSRTLINIFAHAGMSFSSILAISPWLFCEYEAISQFLEFVWDRFPNRASWEVGVANRENREFHLASGWVFSRVL